MGIGGGSSRSPPKPPPQYSTARVPFKEYLPTTLGKEWEIVWEDGLQQLREVGDAPRPEQVVIKNRSNRIANPGIGMAGAASVYKRNTLAGSAAQFEVHPTYYFGLFNNLVRGEVIDSNVIVGPLTLAYPSGFNGVADQQQRNAAARGEFACHIETVFVGQVDRHQDDIRRSLPHPPPHLPAIDDSGNIEQAHGPFDQLLGGGIETHR
ncbi:hypothetical protein [Endothiovibrio diazotrophicus]